MNYLYIFLTIVLTVYGQLVLKWQVTQAGNIPPNLYGKILYLSHLLINLWVISGFLAAFLASLFWMVALSKFELSYAYPFMSFSFVLVLVFSVLFLKEALNIPKIIGLMFIVIEIVIGSKG